MLNYQPAFAQTQEPVANPPRNSPNHTANLAYSLRYEAGAKECSDNNQSLRSKLFVSRDGGATQEERGQEFGGRILAVGTAYNDPRVAYLLVSGKPIVRNSQPDLFFYMSWDAGQTWEKRGEVDLPKIFAGIAPKESACELVKSSIKGLPGSAAPVTAAEVSVWAGRGSTRGITFSQVGVTADGGHTFWYKEPRSDYHYTPDGLLRYKYSENESPTLELLSGDGKTWQKRNLPDYTLPDYPGSGPVNKQPCVYTDQPCVSTYLEQPENASGHLFLSSRGSVFIPELKAALKVWYSPDSGKSWRNLASGVQGVTFSETLPLQVTVVKGDKTIVLDIADVNSTQTLAVQPKNAPGGAYFPDTGHNLYGKFKDYWQANGGLELFGYPLTEQFYEKNPSDGKFYIVQYFERNRFEYHPELAGTKHEVLLGLLGQQLTAKQRSQGNGAFNYFADSKSAKNTYFPQTGHNLRNAFKTHWETNGGLAIFGYPISEEFEEVNPDDNKTYVVQYFERNRFEWHPENEGTKYVVQLGLLGKTLLQEKGWLRAS